MSVGTPESEIEIDVDLARSLLGDQHPDLVDRGVVFLESGWDNATFRLGDELVLRLPRREAAAQLILNEQRWLPVLAAAWALFEDPAARLRVLDEVGADPATRLRARGWAVSFGAMLLDTGLIDHPRHAVMGERTLRRIAEDDFF